MLEAISERLQRVFKTLRGEGHLTEQHVDEALARDPPGAAGGGRCTVGCQGLHGPCARARRRQGGPGLAQAGAAGRQDRPRGDDPAAWRRGHRPTSSSRAFRRRSCSSDCRARARHRPAPSSACSSRRSSASTSCSCPPTRRVRRHASSSSSLGAQAGPARARHATVGDAGGDRPRRARRGATQGLRGAPVRHRWTPARRRVADGRAGRAARHPRSRREVLLVADAMTGQDAVRQAEAFAARLPLTGRHPHEARRRRARRRGALGRLGDRQADSPRRYRRAADRISSSFHPDRMASRILGMGDVLTLIEKAQEVGRPQARPRSSRRRCGSTNSTSRTSAIRSSRLRGGGLLSQLTDLIPGAKALKGVEVDDRRLRASRRSSAR